MNRSDTSFASILILYFFFLAFPMFESLGELSTKHVPNCVSPYGTCIIQLDAGGNYIEYVDKVAIFYNSGKKVVVDGICGSSCTYFVNNLYMANNKSIFITKKAKFGVHKGKDVHSGKEVALLYTGKLQAIVNSKGGLPPNNDVMWITNSELRTIYPTCKGI